MRQLLGGDLGLDASVVEELVELGEAEAEREVMAEFEGGDEEDEQGSSFALDADSEGRVEVEFGELEEGEALPGGWPPASCTA